MFARRKFKYRDGAISLVYERNHHKPGKELEYVPKLKIRLVVSRERIPDLSELFREFSKWKFKQTGLYFDPIVPGEADELIRTVRTIWEKGKRRTYYVEVSPKVSDPTHSLVRGHFTFVAVSEDKFLIPFSPVLLTLGYVKARVTDEVPEWLTIRRDVFVVGRVLESSLRYVPAWTIIRLLDGDVEAYSMFPFRRIVRYHYGEVKTLPGFLSFVVPLSGTVEYLLNTSVAPKEKLRKEGKTTRTYGVVAV